MIYRAWTFVRSIITDYLSLFLVPPLGQNGTWKWQSNTIEYAHLSKILPHMPSPPPFMPSSINMFFLLWIIGVTSKEKCRHFEVECTNRPVKEHLLVFSLCGRKEKNFATEFQKTFSFFLAYFPDVFPNESPPTNNTLPMSSTCSKLVNE